jgi:hypothetical protein
MGEPNSNTDPIRQHTIAEGLEGFNSKGARGDSEIGRGDSSRGLLARQMPCPSAAKVVMESATFTNPGLAFQFFTDT